MDESAILRKIAALLARAEDSASSPAEVAHAIAIADKLMRRYNLSRDEVRLRQEKMRRSERVVSKEDSNYANYIAVAIGRLAQCRTTGERGKTQDHYLFSGLRVDVDYAEWLFRASWAALRQGWEAYRTSPQHEQLIAEGREPTAIEHHYKLGFSMDLVGRMKALAKSAEDAGTSLICLKKELIEQAFGAAKGSSVQLVLIKGNLQAAYCAGADESRKVGLRQSIAADQAPRLGDMQTG